jgi:hypothetical protein
MCIGTSAVLPEIPRGISQMRASCTKQDLVAIEQDLLDELPASTTRLRSWAAT